MTNTTKKAEDLDLNIDLDTLSAIDGLDINLDELDLTLEPRGAIDVTELLGTSEETEASKTVEEIVVETADLSADIDNLVNSIEAEEIMNTVADEEASKPKKMPSVIPSETTKTVKTASKSAPVKKIHPGASASESLAVKVGSDSEKYALTTSDVKLTAEDLSKHQKELTDMLDTLPVKCQKKAVNIISWMNGGSLSVFIDIALRALLEKKEITTAELKATYITGPNGRPYGESTASAQTGNIFKTFDALNIATRNGSSMRINTESLVVQKAMHDFSNAA